MIDAITFIGAPRDFGGICKIYPPTVSEVIANPRYNTYLRLLTISQEELDEETSKNKDGQRFTPLEFLLSCCYNSPEFKLRAEEAFQLFTKERVNFFYNEKTIVFGELKRVIRVASHLEDLSTLTEKNYFQFQNAIRSAAGIPQLKEPPPFDPFEDPRVRRMKEKMRERDRIKAKQTAKGKDTGNGISLSTSLVAICCMGIGITPLNIGELSYAAITPIMNMMQEKEKYDIDIRSLLAGADSKKIKPKYWIRNSD